MHLLSSWRYNPLWIGGIVGRPDICAGGHINIHARFQFLGMPGGVFFKSDMLTSRRLVSKTFIERCFQGAKKTFTEKMSLR